MISQYFEHYHLHHLFEELRKKNGTLYEAFNVTDNDGSNVIVVWADIMLFIYATKWNQHCLQLICETIAPLTKKEVEIFRGQKSLVLQVLEKLKIPFKINNDRFIFDCKKVADTNASFNGTLRFPDISDIPVVLDMSVDYYHEEFDNKGAQSDDAVRESARQGVMSQSIFLWVDDDEIVSMARIIGAEEGNFAIGGLYTVPKKRKKGYAFSIIYKMTKLLLEEGAENCGLLTEATKIPTNKIFEKVGYKNIYNWINIQRL